MKSKSARRALGVTFLYIGIFFALVLLQFGRGGGFSFREGRLSVTAALPRGGGVPESLRVSWPGLSLEISQAQPAILTDAAGSRRNLLLRSVARSGQSVLVELQSGVRLEIAPAAAGESEGFSLKATGGPSGLASLSLAWRLSGGGKLEERAGKRILASAGSAWEFSLPNRALTAVQGRLLLESRGGNLAAFSLARSESPKLPQEAKVVARAAQDPALFKAGIQAWTDRLWAGLQGPRWDETQAAWKEADGSIAFSETALAVWLAEGFQRGQPTEALARGKQAARLHPEMLSWLTVPFLGDTIRKMQGLESQDLFEQKRLATLLAAKDASLFEKEGIVHFLMDRTPLEFARSVLAFAASLDPASLDLEQRLGILSCAVEAEGFLLREENPFPALIGSAPLLAEVRETESGIFLQTGADGSTDLRLSLRAGLALLAWGASSGQDALVGVGQALVQSVLDLADAQGFIPARGFPRAAALEEKSGSIAPEKLYALIGAGSWWPREVSFYREAGPGVWAWTCAPSLSLAGSATSSVYTARFPTGFEHYVSFYGIKPFKNIKLYGIDYRPDPRFEGYNASGYYYRAAAGVLHLKMKHKNEEERMELGY
jgi:hypothetical protein